jgi:hypothetical protein
MEDLALYLDEMVERTIKDFETEPTSVRRAFLACVVVFHGVDYLAFPDNSTGLRQKFRKDSQAFAIVEEVAHAFKHVITGKPSDPRLAASEVIPRPAGRCGEGQCGLSSVGDGIGGVTLIRDPTVDILDMVKRAEKFLREQMIVAPAR